MKSTSSHRHRRVARRGFTLLEIIVVVTIIALLATLVAPRLLGNVGRAKAKVAQNEVAQIAQQVNLYLLDSGMSMVPPDFNLDWLVDDARINADDLLDPWENPYIIIIPGEANIDFDIVSYGADGVVGGEGENADVVN